MGRMISGGPYIANGKFSAGSDLQCGQNVIVDVAEEVVVGDRCLLPDNTYLCGRRIEIGDDFYGYPTNHLGNALDVGRGRIDEEDAILRVGSRCTFHNARIDLARHVTIGDDVGLSPDVVIYTHGYWQSVLEGFPCKYEPVTIGNGSIIGFRSVLLPGANVEQDCVVGAQSVVTGKLLSGRIYGGNSISGIRDVYEPTDTEAKRILNSLFDEYLLTCRYRNIRAISSVSYPEVVIHSCRFDVEACRIVEGEESKRSDDFRWFLFTRGIRIYTKRPFRKLRRQSQ